MLRAQKQVLRAQWDNMVNSDSKASALGAEGKWKPKQNDMHWYQSSTQTSIIIICDEIWACVSAESSICSLLFYCIFVNVHE